MCVNPNKEATEPIPLKSNSRGPFKDASPWQGALVNKLIKLLFVQNDEILEISRLKRLIPKIVNLIFIKKGII